MEIAPLPAGSPWIGGIAKEQFDPWGPLTGFGSCIDYERFLIGIRRKGGLPIVLVASEGSTALGSVNLMPSEMTIRPSLTPWMGQLFVRSECRGTGAGTRLFVRCRYVV